MSFDSLTYSMMKKLLAAGRPLKIALSRYAYTPVAVNGSIGAVDYWSDEKILNIVYYTTDENGNGVQKDYRYRPLSGAHFDDMFTLKKIDGVLTLVSKGDRDTELEEAKRPKPGDLDETDLLPQLTMAGDIALTTIRKYLDAGKPVILKDVRGIMSGIKSGTLTGIMVKDDAWLFQADVDETWTSQAYMSPRYINLLTMKAVDGKLTVSSREENEAN